MKKKKKKRKLRFKGVLIVLLFLYLIGMLIYYFFNMPVKNIIIKNNHLVDEKEIIEAVNISEKTSLFKLSSSSINKKIKKKIPLVEKVEVKKTLLGEVTINVTEKRVLFYNLLKEKLVLSDGAMIDENDSILGVPVLVNYVPSKIYKDFIKRFSKIDEDIVGMISEIEYSPDKKGEITIDEERFILRMNDGNNVHINTVNIEKLNKYQTIYASLEGKGTLYLDSSSKNYIFKVKGEEPKEEEENKEEKKEEENSANED